MSDPGDLVRPPYVDTADSPTHLVQFAQVIEGLREQIEAHLHAVPRAVAPARPTRPLWDPDGGRLWWGDRVVLEVRARGAQSVRTILGAFEDGGWPSRVPNPLQMQEKTYADVGCAIRDLNNKLVSPRPFKFSVAQPDLAWATSP